jgi:hypothetical protein
MLIDTSMAHILSPLALNHNACHLVEAAIGARSAVLDDITLDLSYSTALTRIRGSPSPLNWTIGVDSNASTIHLTFGRAGGWI